MATGIKICKYCGKEYPACKTVFKPGVFRWRDVACCEEHAAKYLEKVLAARNGSVEPKNDLVVPAEPMADGGDDSKKFAAESEIHTPKRSRRKKDTAEEPEIEDQ